MSAAPDTEISSSQIVPTHMNLESKRHNGHHSLTEQCRKGERRIKNDIQFSCFDNRVNGDAFKTRNKEKAQDEGKENALNFSLKCFWDIQG